MMPDLDRIYGPEFFAEWGPGHARYVKSAELITDAVHAEFKPGRIADLGAGCGVYGHFFAKKGTEVVSIDGVVPPAEHSYPVGIQRRDLTVPFENIWGDFDLALCFEVAEHIPESLSDAFLDNILRFSDRLILSAAPPNQGGHHHVNEQPKRYWVAKLAQRGFAYDRRATGRIQLALTKSHPPYMWMMEQISVYDRVKSSAVVTDRLAFSVRHPADA